RRTTDAHVDFLRTHFANHTNDLTAGRAADDGVVDEHNTFALDEAADRIQFQFYAEVADGLRRLDERAADVMIANETHAEGNFRLKCVADRSGDTGVRHGNNDVRVHGMFAREK